MIEFPLTEKQVDPIYDLADHLYDVATKEEAMETLFKLSSAAGSLYWALMNGSHE